MNTREHRWIYVLVAIAALLVAPFAEGVMGESCATASAAEQSVRVPLDVAVEVVDDADPVGHRSANAPTRRLLQPLLENSSLPLLV